MAETKNFNLNTLEGIIQFITNELLTNEKFKIPFLTLYILFAVIAPFTSLLSVFSSKDPFMIFS